ncbi:AraC family transcriptional regulator [Pseudopedobacter beijingensis]|uniref:Helix-turn-helix transcriptional regulator n=1 Tax=Pseudopedobacter beijingensis TaxID=1207056 RepID=A0ABW4IEI4_9SPHI
MVVRSKIEGTDHWLFVENIPDFNTPNESLREQEAQVIHQDYRITNSQIITDSLFILHSTMFFNEEKTLHIEVNGECIASQFVFYNSELKDKKAHTQGKHNIRYIPHFVKKYNIEGGYDINYFMILLSKPYYFHLINQNSRLHESFVENINNQVYSSFFDQDNYVTHDMFKAIFELINNKKQGDIKKLHIETKILELLMYQMEQLHDNTSTDYVTTSSDIFKIEKARKILDVNFTNPPTIKELSREVSLNEFKLKKTFKEYLDTTIYDYVTRIRMEKAKEYLLQENMNIYEIALKVGFKHPPAFSNAFRKYFGISPKEIR